jgi:hypothetical protein
VFDRVDGRTASRSRSRKILNSELGEPALEMRELLAAKGPRLGCGPLWSVPLYRHIPLTKQKRARSR